MQCKSYVGFSWCFRGMAQSREKKIEINHLLLKTHNYKQVTSKHWDSWQICLQLEVKGHTMTSFSDCKSAAIVREISMSSLSAALAQALDRDISILMSFFTVFVGGLELFQSLESFGESDRPLSNLMGLFSKFSNLSISTSWNSDADTFLVPPPLSVPAYKGFLYRLRFSSFSLFVFCSAYCASARLLAISFFGRKWHTNKRIITNSPTTPITEHMTGMSNPASVK